MKQITVIITIFIVCVSSVAAQNNRFEREFFVGANAGAVATRMDFNPSIPQTLKYGVHGGLSAKFISEKHLGFVLELNYSQRGWSEDYADSLNYTYNRTLNYLEIPFMTHIYVGNKTRFIINAGPQISFLLNDKHEMSDALAEYVKAQNELDPGARFGYQYSPISEMKRVEYGLVGGLGVELNTAIGTFDLEGRYYFGLGDIFTNRRTENAYFNRSAHRLIETKLTYYIKMK